MPISVLGALPIGAINVGAAGAVGLATGLLTQLDLALFGSFGLGGIQADLSLQFAATIDAELQIGLQISNPFDTLQALANLMASFSISLPTISLDATLALSANIAAQAAIGLRLGGISALIEAALAVKIPAVNFFASIGAVLSVGPFFLINFQDTLAQGGLFRAGGEIATLFGAGLVSGSDAISPIDPVYGIIIVTKDPAAFASLGAVIRII